VNSQVIQTELRIGRLDKGFTLLEVIVALGILSVGMLGLSTLLYTSLRTDGYNGRVRNAELLALSKMEEFRGNSADATLTTGNGGDVPPSQQEYCRGWTISAPSPAPANISTVQVIVGWPTGGNCNAGSTNPLAQISNNCQYKLRITGSIPQR
jgi:prepilin-type N-terminal cleavage/methylation domain-containing protein